MCGRYVSPEERDMEYHYSRVPDWWAGLQSYDVAPTNHAPILLPGDSEPTWQAGYWMLLPPKSAAKSKWKYSTFNARVEKLDDAKSMAGRAFGKLRCLVPMRGFYEWPGLREGGTLRVYIHPADDGVWWAAGVAQPWTKADGSESEITFTILTQPSNALMSRLHNRGANRNRMPLFIGAKDHDTWLNGAPDEARNLIRPMDSDAMAWHPVARNAGNRPEQVEASGSADLEALAA